jgi:hypothetical protein
MYTARRLLRFWSSRFSSTRAFWPGLVLDAELVRGTEVDVKPESTVEVELVGVGTPDTSPSSGTDCWGVAERWLELRAED